MRLNDRTIAYRSSLFRLAGLLLDENTKNTITINSNNNSRQFRVLIDLRWICLAARIYRWSYVSCHVTHFADDCYYLFYHSQSKLQKQYLPEFLQNIAVYMVVSVDVNPRRSINGRFLLIRNSPESSLSHRHTQLVARASGCQQMF